MSERVLIDNSDSPKFRISKPGKDVSSSDMTDFILREDNVTYYPFFTGSHTFTGSGSATISLPDDFPGLPVAVIKTSDNRLACVRNVTGPSGPYATVSKDGSSITLHNDGVARTITCFVFGNTLETD
jgi:hypothetical protein